MQITSDKPTGKAAQTSRYQQLFSQLTPENNCLVFDEIKEMERVAQALDAWAHRHVKGGKVTTTKRYPKDGKPRCWLIWPEDAIPAKTAIRGNFPVAK